MVVQSNVVDPIPSHGAIHSSQTAKPSIANVTIPAIRGIRDATPSSTSSIARGLCSSIHGSSIHEGNATIDLINFAGASSECGLSGSNGSEGLDGLTEIVPLPPLEIPSKSKTTLLVPLTPVSWEPECAKQPWTNLPPTPDSKGQGTFLSRLLHSHSANTRDKTLYVDPLVHRTPDRLLQTDNNARGLSNMLWCYDPYTQQVFTTANCSLHDVRLAIEVNEYFPMMVADAVQSTIEGLLDIDWFRQCAATPVDGVFVEAASTGEPVPRAQYILHKCIAAVYFESARWLIDLSPPSRNDDPHASAGDECHFAFVDCLRHLDVLGALGEPLWALDQGIKEIYSGPNISVQDHLAVILRWLYIGCCYDPDTSFDALPTLNPHRLVLSDSCFFPIVQRKLAYHALHLPSPPAAASDWLSHLDPGYSLPGLCRLLDIDVHSTSLSRLLDDTTLACDRFAANLAFLDLSSHYPPAAEHDPILIDMRFILESPPSQSRQN